MVASSPAMKHFALVMSVLYVLAGGLLLATDILHDRIGVLRVPLGITLVIYGTVRAYLWRRKYADGSGDA